MWFWNYIQLYLINFVEVGIYEDRFSLYRVIKNYCQGFNNLSYTIHLR